MLQIATELVCWLVFPRTNSLTFLLYIIATLALLYTFRIIPTFEIRRNYV